MIRGARHEKELGRKNAVCRDWSDTPDGFFYVGAKSQGVRASIPRSAAQTAGRERFQRRDQL